MSNEWLTASSELRTYYERRAPVYDDTVRKESRGEAAEVLAVMASMAPAKTLDIACGTGFLTTVLRGDVIGLDQSASMLRQTRAKASQPRLVRGDAFRLPFRSAAFERATVGFFYGHLVPPARQAFLNEVRRVAGEIVVVDSAMVDGAPVEEWQKRTLPGGESYSIYTRRFTPAALIGELGQGTGVFEGRWIVAVRAKAA